VIISTHIVEDVADLCDQVAILARGQILASGTPASLAAVIDGRVWQGPGEEYGDHATLLARRFKGGRRIVRVLANESPGSSFERVSATLEDAYFAAVGSQTMSKR